MVTLLHMIHHDTSSQKTRDVILKCDRYIFTKCDKSLLENVPRFSSQNVSFITKCDHYYKMLWYRELSIRLLQTSLPLQPVSL